MVSGGYEGNDAVANHIWDSLAQNERVNVLVEAEMEQEPLPNIHQDWLTPEERAIRGEQEINSEVMRRIQRRDQATQDTLVTEPPTMTGPTMTLTQHSANHDRSVAHAMQTRDDEPEEDEEDINIPTLKTNTPRRARRSPRIA